MKGVNDLKSLDPDRSARKRPQEASSRTCPELTPLSLSKCVEGSRKLKASRNFEPQENQ